MNIFLRGSIAERLTVAGATLWTGLPSLVFSPALDRMPASPVDERGHVVVSDLVEALVRAEIADEPIQIAVSGEVVRVILPDFLVVAPRRHVDRERPVAGTLLRLDVGPRPGLYPAFDLLGIFFVGGFGRAVKAMTVELEVVSVEGAFGAFIDGHFGTSLTFWFLMKV